MKKAASEYWGEVCPISLAESTEIVKKLLSGKAPGRDEIYPEMLKAPDIIGLSWLACFFDAQWKLGTVPGVADRGDGSHFQKEVPESVLQSSEYHTAGPAWDSLFSRTGSQGDALVRRSVWFGNLRITVFVFVCVFSYLQILLSDQKGVHKASAHLRIEGLFQETAQLRGLFHIGSTQSVQFRPFSKQLVEPRELVVHLSRISRFLYYHLRQTLLGE